jgi:hypothetical protein
LPLVPAGFDWPAFAMLALGFALLYGPTLDPALEGAAIECLPVT